MTSVLNRSFLTDSSRTSTKYQGPLDRLDYPERVVQFGSGALLRGFMNFFIDQANRQGVFQGRAVVVNNTNSGRGALLNEQDGLFTLCVEGFADGETQQEYLINASISRALPAVDHWPEVLKCAANPDITVVTSNTTEVGITLQEDDDLSAQPPQSFPGKLTAFLYERFKQLGGTAETGLVMLPTELIIDNGTQLRDIVLRLAEINQLEDEFVAWVTDHNLFCNTLVDRIVPGEPDEAKQQVIERELGYRDGLLTVSEVYRFFAIEGDESLLYNKVPFLKTDPGIVIAPDITPFRERKLRILNGGHTISVAAGFLCGLETVHDCLEDAVMGAFITQAIHDEIVPSLEIDPAMAREFAEAVLDRFRNPFINHQLISITLQYTSKMNMRNGLTFRRYYDRFGHVPERMSAGFAAYLLFTRPTQKKDDQYFGEFDGETYPIRDDAAAYFYERWSGVELSDSEALAGLVHEVLGHDSFWDQDLLQLGDFSDRVAHYLTQFGQHGVRATLKELTTP
ncbi:MAG: tagaturonate reductase [Tunicatimonas sp.]